MKVDQLKRGDACPNCGGDFKPARIPTDAEFQKSIDRENPAALPAGSDTASPDFRAEHGELHKCADCGYVTRLAKAEPAPADAAGDAAADAPAKGTRKKATTTATAEK